MQGNDGKEQRGIRRKGNASDGDGLTVHHARFLRRKFRGGIIFAAITPQRS